MSADPVPSRELRNNTAGVLRRVEAGEEVTITVRGRPVAQIVPIGRERKRRPLQRDEVVDILRHHQADPGLRRDLERLAGDTTDDIPIR